MLDAVPEVHEAHLRRLARVDPWVRVAPLDVTRDSTVEWSSDSQAVVLVDVRETDAGSEAGLWVADRVVRLQVRAASDDAAAALGGALERAHRIGAGAGPTQVSVASRDIALTRPLLRAGFAPNAILAVHHVTRSDVQPDAALAADDALAVRPAEPDDLDAVVAATVAVQAFDARVGSLPDRPAAERVIRPAAEKALRERPGWSWVAERGGAVVGVCRLEPPEDAGWVSGEVASPSTVYLAELHVDPTARGQQVGTRLVAAAHLRAAAAGAEVVLLHHSAANPLSTPFWGRAGYRPLITGWTRWVP